MRTLRVATASFLIDDAPHTVAQNLERARTYVRDAGKQHCDILCLPETVTTSAVPNPLHYAAQSDEWMRYFSALAKEFNIAIVAPFYVAEAGKIYNQATLFTRDGTRAGLYRKLQPTGSEAHSVTPGSELPIIEFGGVRAGIMICMDIYFPEIARIYAMKGAEILFWPT